MTAGTLSGAHRVALLVTTFIVVLASGLFILDLARGDAPLTVWDLTITLATASAATVAGSIYTRKDVSR